MSLIKHILKRGLTLAEIKEKIKKENLEISEDMINQEILKEKQRIIAYIGNNNTKEIEKVERLFSVISNQSVVDGKILVLEREYKSNGGRLKEGYISNLFHFGNLEENKYLMTYLFNRLKNQKNLTLEGYNLEYLMQEERCVFDIIKVADILNPQRSEAFENWLKALEMENQKRREEHRQIVRGRKKRDEIIEDLEESPVDKMILEMLGNVRNAKKQYKKKSEDSRVGNKEH